jgi:hypothetical protein
MNDRISNSEMVNLERSLRALADEDFRLQAPAHVQAAVMQTWDAVRPFARHTRHGRRRPAAILAMGSMAAAVVAAVVMNRPSSQPSRAKTDVAPAERPRVIPNLSRIDRETRAEVHGQRPRRARSRVETPLTRYGAGTVFVADPVLDASAATIVRVRVPRTALVTLGVPLVEPDDRGLVDLEMLVGEDGVTRTIRRAVPVAVREE